MFIKRFKTIWKTDFWKSSFENNGEGLKNEQIVY